MNATASSSRKSTTTLHYRVRSSTPTMSRCRLTTWSSTGCFHCTIRTGNRIQIHIYNVRYFQYFSHVYRSRIVWTEGNTLHLTMEFLQSGDAGQYTCISSNRHRFIAHTNVAVKPSCAYLYLLCITPGGGYVAFRTPEYISGSI